VPTIDGTATFYKRVNGQALAVVQLKTPQLVDHIQATFTWIVQLKEESHLPLTVNGDTGISKTNVSKLNDGAFGYDQVLTMDILTFTKCDWIKCLSSSRRHRSKRVNWKKKISFAQRCSGISGTVELAERINQTTLVTIRLSGTPAGGSHPAHIHENNVATSGNIIAGLNPVDGTTGISKTQVSALVGVL
jgi:hypothetical protein